MTLAPSTQFNALAVPLGLLRRYLLANHWRPIDAPQPPPLPAHLQKMAASFMGGRVGGERNFDLYVLSAPDQQDIELVVPGRIDDVDFRMRMESVLETLCALTALDQGAMVTEIRAIGFDLVQSKIPNNLVLDDSVQLEIAASYIDNIRELLAATATTELDPTPFYPRAVPAATKYADACRFGHTFRGSFGFTIESSIDEKPPQLALEIGENPPFERRVIQRLARGVVATCRAVDTGDIRPLVESVSTGFGANACERFAKLIEDTFPGGLTMSFSVSPEWKADPEIDAASEYVCVSAWKKDHRAAQSRPHGLGFARESWSPCRRATSKSPKERILEFMNSLMGALSGVRYRTGRIARFVARTTGNTALGYDRVGRFAARQLAG